jgi:hypothetical protein
MADATCKVCQAVFFVADGTDVGTEFTCEACGAEGTLQMEADKWVLEPVESSED